MLDAALFRRFDDVIEYTLPDDAQIRALTENRLNGFAIGRIGWRSLYDAARGLSHADVTRACADAAKDAILEQINSITTKTLVAALEQRRVTDSAASIGSPTPQSAINC